MNILNMVKWKEKDIKNKRKKQRNQQMKLNQEISKFINVMVIAQMLNFKIF